MKKFLFSVVSLLLVTATVSAQDVESKPEQKGEASDALSAIRLANNLVVYGYAQQSALPLIQALQILNENQTQPLKAERIGATVDASKADGKKSQATFDVEKILADAAKFADGDATLMKLIEQVKADAQGAHRGRLQGPSRTNEIVKGYDTDTYSVSFTANSLAEVLVVGDGDTDLDLYIYDSNGNLIASDVDYTDNCYVSWVPAWTGRFSIKIKNRGGVYNRYVMVTN